MVSIGKVNSLKITEIIEQKVWLDGLELGAIPLSRSCQTSTHSIGDNIDAFIYHDNKSQLIATTQKPLACVGQFVSLKVKEINNIGAFMNLGIEKDLLVPFGEQKRKMEAGRHYLVRLYLDQHNERLVASSKIDKFLNVWPATYKSGDQVNLTIATRTDLGFKAIINDQHWGLLYQNEIFQPLRTGQKVTGYIKNLRDDGNIDLSLSKIGKGKVTDFSQVFLQHLADNQGFSTINDKSSPALIQKIFGISKKNFKATVGHLLKQNKITLEANGIRLNTKAK